MELHSAVIYGYETKDMHPQSLINRRKSIENMEHKTKRATGKQTSFYRKSKPSNSRRYNPNGAGKRNRDFSSLVEALKLKV
jgi:hypothetical protein